MLCRSEAGATGSAVERECSERFGRLSRSPGQRKKQERFLHVKAERPYRPSHDQVIPSRDYVVPDQTKGGRSGPGEGGGPV